MKGDTRGIAIPSPAAWPTWPTFALHEDLLPTLMRWEQERQDVALATLVQIRGSSPRVVGSQMAINGNREVVGYLSGGCVEAAVAEEALATLDDGHARLLRYGDGSPYLDIQLGCGGSIDVLVHPIADLRAHIALRQTARLQRETLRIAMNLTSGASRRLGPHEREAADEYVQRLDPPIRLILVGGDPTALAIIELAPRFGIEVQLIRPHGPDLPPPGLKQAQYDRRALLPALNALRPDCRTAIYSLMHDGHADLEIAQFGLGSEATLVGILGSRTKLAGRVDKLLANGVDPVNLQKLRMPAGLRIGASSTPFAIALGIMTEVIDEMDAVDAA